MYIIMESVLTYLFYDVEIYKFRVKGSKTNASTLYLGNDSKDFLVDKMKKTELYGYINDFSNDHDSVDVDDISNIHKHLMKKTNIKCLDLLKDIFCVIKYLYSEKIWRIISI